MQILTSQAVALAFLQSARPSIAAPLQMVQIDASALQSLFAQMQIRQQQLLATGGTQEALWYAMFLY